MSSTLCWTPTKRDKEFLSDELKFVLRKKNGDVTIDSMILSDCDMPYLEGLKDAGISGIDELIEAIEKHDQVTLSEEF